jgi:hypothetical protein
MPRLDRGIQYAAASRHNYCRSGILDRPVKPGDDSERVARKRVADSRERMSASADRARTLLFTGDCERFSQKANTHQCSN